MCLIPCCAASANTSQDIECNRYNPGNKNQGMFVKKTPKKKAKVQITLTFSFAHVLTLLGRWRQRRLSVSNEEAWPVEEGRR